VWGPPGLDGLLPTSQTKDVSLECPAFFSDVQPPSSVIVGTSQTASSTWSAPDRPHHVHTTRPTYRRDLGAKRLGNLHSERADAAGCTVNQDLLSLRILPFRRP
jgi:hypothetical protein